MKEKISKIKVLALDVDGVLTDGRIIIDSKGKELRNFDVQDGFAIVVLRKLGFKTAIISARSAPAVTARAKDLKFDKVYQDAYPKLASYEKMLKVFKVTDQEVCFVGDDLPDLPVLQRAGFAVAVANATNDVKHVCDYITTHAGGHGAVREVIEVILKAQGKWESVISSMKD